MNPIPNARLVAPRLPPRCISRPRLTSKLAAAIEHPLTLIAAGPGSGKTVMLSQWVLTQPTAPAWVSLGPTDNEPDSFWPLIADAFAAAGARSLDLDDDEFPGEHLDDGTRLVNSFLAAASDEKPLVLVLDDAHVLTHPRVLEGLDALMRRGWTRLRLVLSARTDPLLALHRYRLAGQISELRALDLAMTRPEAKALLTAHGVSLSTREFDVLATRTEGWAAGLRLSAMSMEGTGHPEEFVSEFALDQGSVGEYLMNEVLDRQPEDVRTLLIETSFLGEVNGDLAAAVTGFPDAGVWLAELSRTNAFVVPLDRAADRFRYHQLFGEILRYLLQREPHEHRRELLNRAADWYFDRGKLADALHLTVDGKDWEHAASMLLNGGIVRTFIAHEDLSFVQLGDAANDAASGHDDVAVARAALRALAGQPTDAGAPVVPEQPDSESTCPDGTLLAMRLTDFLVARAEHRGRDLEILAEGVSDAAGDSPPVGLEAALLLERAAASFWDGNYDDTDTMLAAAHRRAVSDRHPGMQLRCLSMQALVHAYWGRFRASHNDERQADALIRHHLGMSAPATLHLAQAVRAFHQADFQAAARALTRAELKLADETDTDVHAAVRLVRGLLIASMGRLGAAQAVLATTDGAGSDMLQNFRWATLADMETALGRPQTAVKMLVADDIHRRSSAAAVALARAYVALGDLRSAEDTVRPILAAVDATTTRPLLIEALMTQAQIALARGDETKAVESLIRGCELSTGEIILPFVRVADVFIDVVARHASLADLWPSLDVTPIAVLPNDDTEVPGARLPEPLTDRERTVLRWLSTTMSTTEIADELCLSVNTVKTHIAAIYRKLAAAKRRDAVLRARTLELL